MLEYCKMLQNYGEYMVNSVTEKSKIECLEAQVKCLAAALAETNIITKEEIKALKKTPVKPTVATKMVRQRLADMHPAPHTVPNNYVLCVASTNSHEFLLVKKSKPDWQAGLLNAPGGKINDGESALAACVREFKEETGIKTNEHQWQYVGKKFRKAEFDGDDRAYNMHIFVCDEFSSEQFAKASSKKQNSDEPVVTSSVVDLILRDYVPGLVALVWQSQISYLENSVFSIEEQIDFSD
jgi:8-oxo-dGTP pyrophosphatase MutT (NUDIX family)